MEAATITVRRNGLRNDDRAENDPLLRQAFGDALSDCRFSHKPAPDGRGVEVHASSGRLPQKEMKAKLRAYRALVEAGEIPTGARSK
jgi:hypothetical protein